MKIAIIGAGAAGMAAALQAGWAGADVTLFERNEALGRKLLVTGSGRCNISNAAAAAEKYTCTDPAWLGSLLGSFGVGELLSMLREIGIPVYKTSDGWYYPLSESAHSVVEAFSSALNLAGVKLRVSARVKSLRVGAGGLALGYISGGQEAEDEFERVIVAAGGKSYPTLGSRGELFPMLAGLGHTVLPLRPALAPVLAELGMLKSLQGQRLDVGVSLWEGQQRLGYAAGNLIITGWGLNGPAVMDISQHISAHPKAALELSLNLLTFVQAEFDTLLAEKRVSDLPLRVFLNAFFAPRVGQAYLKYAGLAGEMALRDVDDSALEKLIARLRDTRLAVKGVRDFEFCQVTAGGVPVEEVDPLTLESRRVKGLYLAGETLDVVGPCGGYNLQFAFSSGALAGKAAAA